MPLRIHIQEKVFGLRSLSVGQLSVVLRFGRLVLLLEQDDGLCAFVDRI